MRAILKSLVKRVCGERLLGIVDYYRYPKLSLSGAFNSQQFRQRLFQELIGRIAFSAIVETGTFRGNTTEYLYETARLSVYTVELSPRHYGYARHRFRGHRGIFVNQGDSRAFLKRLARRSQLTQGPVFFYLDAHWYDDCPLKEELAIVFDAWPEAVVMIDDFQVPGDPAYRYYTHDQDGPLCLEYLNRPDLRAFFPSQKGELESGARTGCVVLAKDEDLLGALRQCDALVGYAEPSRTAI